MFSLDASQPLLPSSLPSFPWHAGSQDEGSWWVGGLPQVRYPQGGQTLGLESRGIFSEEKKKEINICSVRQQL